MYESRIAADHLTVTAVEGFPPELNTLAACNLAGHGFLRAAWYAASAPHRGRTLLLRRDADGAALAAIPTIAFGPAISRARKVPGSYWPLRSALIAPDCNVVELAHALGHSAATRCLGGVWRMGPVRSDDPANRLLVAAAQIANWTVLSRPAGTSWLIDLDAARMRGWPSSSAARKLRAVWRKLEGEGRPSWRHVRGGAWDTAVLRAMGEVEASSWIARTTDGSGAKFMTAAQRAHWSHALTDPVLAEMLCATILMLDNRPVAFSFDLDDGPLRYGIAGSYVETLGHLGIGKLTNTRAMEDAIADGQRVMDMGVGDSGYKRAMGAVEGYAMADLLFVRSRSAAMMLAQAWGPGLLPTPATRALMPGRVSHG